MPIADEAIEDFIEAWKEDFGETLTPEVARMEANRLLDFFASINEVLQGPESRPSEAGGHGDVGDVLREAWRKTMRRAHEPRPEQESP